MKLKQQILLVILLYSGLCVDAQTSPPNIDSFIGNWHPIPDTSSAGILSRHFHVYPNNWQGAKCECISLDSTLLLTDANIYPYGGTTRVNATATDLGYTTSQQINGNGTITVTFDWKLFYYQIGGDSVSRTYTPYRTGSIAVITTAPYSLASVLMQAMDSLQNGVSTTLNIGFKTQ